MIKKVFLAALGVIFLGAFAATPVYAEGEDTKPAIWLQISPVSERVVLEPGKSLDYQFNVENIGGEAFTYKVYATPYGVTNKTYELNFSTETERTQVSRWITFQDANGNFAQEVSYTIEPGTKQTIPYRISVPASIPDGGQYATIFAESIPSSAASQSSGIKTVSRVGLVIYGRSTGETVNDAEILDYQFNSFLTSGQVNSSATVKNSGNTDFETRYNLVVKSLFGKTIFEKKAVYDVLPDTERDVAVEWPETPLFGIFRITSTVTALDQSEDHTKIVLIIPLFILIIMLVLLTILVIWLIMIIRKRKEQKSRLVA
ncbi:hypothetical protein IJG73_02075 [Candidatus Saccharibacteria bacterium]|nr:hypothetical protein [Candidatus Saccharibacteria bacterium]